MTSRKPWIPPPCQTTILTKKRSERISHPNKQESSALDVISQEITKLENLVASLDQALKDNKSLTAAKIQNETDLEKEQKRLSKSLSSMQVWHGEQKNLLQTVLSEINNINSSLTTFSGDFKRNKDAKESRITILNEELEFLEKHYIRHISCLKKQLWSYKLQSTELNSVLKLLKKELSEKEATVGNLTDLCQELKASVSEHTIKNEALELANQELKKSAEALKLSKKPAIFKNKSTCTDEHPKHQVLNDKLIQENQIQNKMSKLQQSNHDYQERVRKLERKLKRSQLTISQINVRHDKEKANWEAKKVPEMSIEMVDEIKKLKEDINNQGNQLCLVNELLKTKNKEVEDLRNQNEELKLQQTSQVSFLKSELEKALNSETSLRGQLKHLKSSYAALFSDHPILEESSHVT